MYLARLTESVAQLMILVTEKTVPHFQELFFFYSKKELFFFEKHM